MYGVVRILRVLIQVTTVLTNVADALLPTFDPKFNDKYNMVQAYLSLNF